MGERSQCKFGTTILIRRHLGSVDTRVELEKARRTSEPAQGWTTTRRSWRILCGKASEYSGSIWIPRRHVNGQMPSKQPGCKTTLSASVGTRRP